MPRVKKRSPRVSDVPTRARGLLELPNVGPAIALDLVKLGISEPKQLARRDADRMYEALCKIDGVRHDPCLLDVFTSVVAFVNGAPARPWWAYTPGRKARRKPAR
jgi:pathogenicity locus Cdd1 protein